MFCFEVQGSSGHACPRLTIMIGLSFYYSTVVEITHISWLGERQKLQWNEVECG